MSNWKLQAGRWKDMFCICPPEFSVTGRLFNHEARMTPEEFVEATKVFLKEFPGFKNRIKELIESN